MPDLMCHFVDHASLHSVRHSGRARPTPLAVSTFYGLILKLRDSIAAEASVVQLDDCTRDADALTRLPMTVKHT
jgi:hypothetical protein